MPIGRMGNIITNRVSTARAAMKTPGGFVDAYKTRGLRHAVGSMGGHYGLKPTAGFSAASSHQYDKAFQARGAKRIAGAVAAGSAVGGYGNRTTSGLNKGQSGMRRF